MPLDEVSSALSNRAPAPRSPSRSANRLDEERTLALRLRAARAALWRALLATPLRDALLRELAEHLPPEVDATPATLARLDAGTALARAALTRARREVEDPQLRDACERAAQAERRARDAFVAANMGLVVMIARRYEQGHLSFADLIQEGNTGLLRAVDRFDLDRGHRFSTYAVWWIRHAIGRALSDKSREIRLPVHVVEQQHTVLRARSDFENRHGRTPTASELSGHLGFSRKKIEFLLSLHQHRAHGARSAEEGRLLDVDELADPEPGELDLDQDALASGLQEALSRLSTIEQEIIRCRFGLDGTTPMTLREVGERHRLSRERIRQLQERALDLLRREFSQRGLA